MVDIRIVVEGGIIPHSNDSAMTINNSEKLRESFYKLFTQIFHPSSFNLIIEMKGGIGKATKAFKDYAKINQNTSLLIDLDGDRATKQQKLSNLQVDQFAEKVFFMIQEMEAWILSQPEAIEKAYKDRFFREKGNVQILEAEKELFQVHPEEIKKPSFMLKVLLGKYYSEMKGNTKKKKKYGKLKDAPLLIENLNIHKLIETFEDLRLMKDLIEK
jgi:hypothetical protein